MSRWTVKEVHITAIRPGDTVLHLGKERTVCNKDLRNCSFMGPLLFGDSYQMGTQMVEKIIIERARPIINDT